MQKANEQSVEIDLKLVNAQQGRRVIDRLFGYQLSPLLWKKVKSRLSGARAVHRTRLICEREDVIENFIPLEYWDISANCTKGKTHFEAELAKITAAASSRPRRYARNAYGGHQSVGDKNIVVRTEAGAKKIEAELTAGESTISDIRSKETKRYASPPFITSTLQQPRTPFSG